jgi:hypothetical protein
VAGEFKDLTLHLGGKVVALDGESGNHLNALQILRAGESDQISYNQHTAKMATIYQYLRPSADDVELKMFQRILSELYQQMGIITGDSADGYQIAIDIGTYPADEYPLWSDVKTRIEEEKRRAEKEGKTATAEFERLTNISETIGNLCSVYGNIFNHHTTMANIFKEPILCFDIKNLSLMNSEIFDAQVFNVLTLCWSNIVEVGGDMKRLWENGEIDWEDITRSFILIDEAHRWINANKTTAVAQIGQMEREGRKYFAGLGIASQQLRDFVPDHASREGIDEIKNLFELSTYKFILRQDSNTIDKFRQVLGNTCTDRELEQIPMLDQGETILSISGLGNIKFDVYVSEESLNLYRGGA